MSSEITHEVPDSVLRILFDALVNSMDFGSGFLDSEDVEALRAVAVMIGVDPMDGTPSDFAHQYPHTFRGRTLEHACMKCGRYADFIAHQ
jgi:hypothetical protein